MSTKAANNRVAVNGDFKGINTIKGKLSISFTGFESLKNSTSSHIHPESFNNLHASFTKRKSNPRDVQNDKERTSSMLIKRSLGNSY
jgi:hypothetical protein